MFCGHIFSDFPLLLSKRKQKQWTLKCISSIFLLRIWDKTLNYLYYILFHLLSWSFLISFMDSIPVDLLRVYRDEECRIFSRMVFILGLEPNLSMKIIAFWLWLEENKCKDVIQRLNSLDDRYLLAVCDVAKSFLDSLRLSYSSKDHTHPSEGHFKQAFRDVAICGINYHLDNVCHKVSLDIRKQVHQSCIDKLVEEMDRVHFGAESIRNQNSFHTNNGILRCKDLVQYHSTMKDVANSCLSSNVSSLTNRKTPREERMLFVTFSNGHPLSEEQLQAFFMRYSRCLARLYIPENS